MTRKQDRATAYHEAGHAVASYIVRRGLRVVTIVPDSDAGTLGECHVARFGRTVQPDVALTPRTRAALEAQITVMLAGAIAERRFCGRWSRIGASLDASHAVELATHLCGSDEETSAFLGWRHIVTEQLLSQPWHWAAVRDLARELVRVRTVRGKRAREIIQSAIASFGSPKDRSHTRSEE